MRPLGKDKAVRIVLDGMGGDHAPAEVVKGAVGASLEYGVEVVLVGKRDMLEGELRQLQASSKISIVDASDAVDFNDQPSKVRHLKDSSIMVAMNLLKSGEAQALVSAGNTGAVMAAALFVLGRIKGFDRPALCAIFPTPSPDLLLIIDVGANADCKPHHLVQFAQMGTTYMERVFGMKSPRVGLLSNGEEDTKGNQLVRDAHKAMRKTELNFIGNIEGKDIWAGVADVIVTDGFTGNVLIKASEGFSALALNFLKQTLQSRLEFRIPGFLLNPAFAEFKKRMDYSEYGGVPLLGVDGNVICAHGRSDANAIKNAIRIANQSMEQGMPEAMRR